MKNKVIVLGPPLSCFWDSEKQQQQFEQQHRKKVLLLTVAQTQTVAESRSKNWRLDPVPLALDNKIQLQK